ncbi:putative transcription factor C2H2 family [Helianthus anomalus]
MASPLSPHPLNMKTTILAGEPSSFSGETGNTERRVAYDVGFALIVLLFIIILTYTAYMCKRITRSRSPPPPPPTTSFHTTADSDTDDFHSFSLSTGLEDDILSSFPTGVYSEFLNPHKVVETDHDHHVVNIIDTECSICLSDYGTSDVVRLLPECGHLFHVSCIDKWLKVHPTCPVCRKSPLPTLRS